MLSLRQQMRTRQQARSSLTLLAALVGSFIACWMPHHIYFILRSFDKVDSNVTVAVRIASVRLEVAFSFQTFTNLCGAFSCFCNALVYGIFNHNLRTGFVRTLRCHVCVWLVPIVRYCIEEIPLQPNFKQHLYD